MTIVFDLDGTLLDTLTDLTNSVNYSMSKLSLPLYTCAQVQSMIGNGVKMLVTRALTSCHVDKLDEALHYQQSYYLQHSDDNTHPYSGVLQLLDSLHNNGHTIVVHTNKNQDVANLLCNKYFGNKVDYVIGTTNFALTKPNTTTISQWLQTNGVQINNVVYVGDSEVDYQTANALGVPFVAVTWGFRSQEFLQNVGVTQFANSTSKLLEVICNNLSNK